MATTNTSDTTFSDILKQEYEPIMQNQLVEDSEARDLYTPADGFEVTEGPDGKQINIAHLFSAGGGGGFMGESDYLYTSTNPNIKQSHITIKQAMVAAELSGRTLRRVKQGPTAFADWATEVLPLKVQYLAHLEDRALLGAGNGIVARVNDAAPSTSGTGIDTAYGITGLAGAEFLFAEGDTLRWGPNADGTSLRTGAAVVTGIDYANKKIQIDAVPTSAADNDYIFMGTANVNGSGSVEAMGLEGIVDDGTNVATFQGLSRTTYLKMNAQIIDAATAQNNVFAGALSEDLLDFADRQAWMRGRGKPDYLLTSYSGRSSFWKSRKDDRRINDPSGDYIGGRGTMRMRLGDRVIELKCARKVPESRAFLNEKKSLKFYRVGQPHWDDTTGTVWDRVIDSTGRKDAFWAVFIDEFEVASGTPNHNVKIINLAAA